MKIEIEIKLQEGVDLHSTCLDTPAVALRKLRIRQEIEKRLAWQLDTARWDEKVQRKRLWEAVADENDTKSEIEAELKLLDQ